MSPVARRSLFIISNIRGMPPCNGPTSQPTESSRFITHVGDACRPIFSSVPEQVTPLCSEVRLCEIPSSPPDCQSSDRNFGTRKRDIPRVPSGPPDALARTRWTMFSAMSCSP